MPISAAPDLAWHAQDGPAAVRDGTMTDHPTPARAILLAPPALEGAAIHAAFLAEAGDRPVWLWPDLPAPEAVGCLVAFRVPPGAFERLPNLRLVHCTGAGVNQLLAAPGFPDGVPVARVADIAITRAMVQHVLHALLREYRDYRSYEAFQRERRWHRLPQREASEWPVGVMGLGTLGTGVADALLRLGFPVRGWSRGPRSLDGVACFAGEEGLAPFLDGCAALVILLPLTEETRGLVDARVLGALRRGAVVVAVGRGGQVVEDDLLAALETGHLAHAYLDVMEQEPLPGNHPLWAYPGVTVTPHIASPPVGAPIAGLVLENLRRLEADEPLLHAVDRQKGY